eukprot:CAMPEP_0198141834 /NCGR_PEP_ID=MMETSP1443-20131203/4769_1 /TAXON_ID=186043 /ORGANISM="Entomoneis sp., Strain CCMP2396" /LENGTH=86 /DNA_ID=CAMNT_0043804697 /DNA_START=108 /DNA_END=368 /DNA_ORIENTATION=-
MDPANEVAVARTRILVFLGLVDTLSGDVPSSCSTKPMVSCSRCRRCQLGTVDRRSSEVSPMVENENDNENDNDASAIDRVPSRLIL